MIILNILNKDNSTSNICINPSFITHVIDYDGFATIHILSNGIGLEYDVKESMLDILEIIHKHKNQ